MRIWQYKLLVVACVVLGLLVSACGAPESCGENIGGTADEAAYAQRFARMALVNEGTGQPGAADPEGGVQFAAADRLAIQVESLAEVTVRACVQERKGGGKIALNQSQTVGQGEDSFALGSFERGSYVVRVIVDGTLVKNLPFVVK